MDDLEEKILKTLEHVKTELAGVRGARAHPALVEEIHVEAYGAAMRIKDLASITIPEPKMIEIRAWDTSLTGALATAVEAAKIGANPMVAGDVIRIALPALTDDRRMQIKKIIGNICEEGRIALRQERDQTLEKMKRQQKDGEISEDDLHRMKDSVDEAIKKANDTIAEMKTAKDEEIDAA